jgi:hypothetical protein
MKKLLIDSMQKALYILLILVVMLTGISLNAIAAGPEKKTEGDTYSVTYMGESKQGLVFKVQYVNVDISRYRLVLKNEDGLVLLDKYYTDKRLSETIILPKEDSSKSLSFTIQNRKGNYTRNFFVVAVTKNGQADDILLN